MAKDKAVSTADSAADSSGESVVSSQSDSEAVIAPKASKSVNSGAASEAASTALLTSANISSNTPIDSGNGKTPSDVASALKRELEAIPRAPVETALASSVELTPPLASMADSFVVSVANSSANIFEPIPVTSGWEQASASVLESQLIAAGWTPGTPVTDYIKVTESAGKSAAASKALSEGRAPEGQPHLGAPPNEEAKTPKTGVS